MMKVTFYTVAHDISRETSNQSLGAQTGSSEFAHNASAVMSKISFLHIQNIHADGLHSGCNNESIRMR